MKMKWIVLREFNPRNHGLMAGDVGLFGGEPSVLRDSRGWGKRNLGELTPVKLKPSRNLKWENGKWMYNARVVQP